MIAANPAFSKGPFTEAALLWDAAWYMGIVKDGYALPPPPATSNLAFPPLLPLLTRLLGEGFNGLGCTWPTRSTATGRWRASWSATWPFWPGCLCSGTWWRWTTRQG